MRPLIGLTTSLYEGDPSRPNRAVVNAAYISAIEAVGGVPILLSPHHTAASTRELMDIVSGVVVSGGGDVDPARYGQSPDPTCTGISVLRDEYEAEVIALAMERELPLLLICRGMQLFNVIRGGTLVQDIPASQAESPDRHGGGGPELQQIIHSQEVARHIATHSVRVTPGSKLATTLGSERVMTNSMHHQAVDRTGEGVEVVAWADDGVVEGYEMPLYPGWLLGVQWHPEELVSGNAAAHALFTEFLQASVTRRPAASK